MICQFASDQLKISMAHRHVSPKKIILSDTNTVILLKIVIMIEILKMQFCYFLTYYLLIYCLYIDTTLAVSNRGIEWKDLRRLSYNFYGKWHKLVQVLLWHFVITTQYFLAWFLLITSYSGQETVTGVWLKFFKKICH